MKTYKRAALGGTFDRLHNGHKAFISYAAQQADELVIGLTTDLYLRTYKPESKILPYEQRKKELETYLNAHHLDFVITPIDVNEIPKEYEKHVDVLITSTDSLDGAEKINTYRLMQKLPILPVVTVPLLTHHHKTIASTRIREGQIDREGEPFLKNDMTSETYILPPHLRTQLQTPFGDLIDEAALKTLRERPLISVGDITTKICLENDIKPDISIIDFVVERVKRYTDIKDLGFSGTEHVYHHENKKSTISPGVFRLIAHLFYSNTNTHRKSIIVISGEEDLIVLPVILLAPLGAVVLYGQPKVGMVKVTVTEHMKLKMRDILSQFDKIHD